MEVVFELIFQVILEVVLQLALEFAVGLGWESLKHATRRERAASPWLSGIGWFLMGLIAGGVSLLVVPFRLTTKGMDGTSLIVSPLVTGVFSHLLGKWWQRREKMPSFLDRPTMFTFRAGALFAFAMALVRWLVLVVEWQSWS